MGKRVRTDAGNCAVWVCILIAVIVLLAMCSGGGDNYCDGDKQTDLTTAQGQHDMKNCAKGWD